MKTRNVLAGGALLVLGGVVCATFVESTSAQVKLRVAAKTFTQAHGPVSGCVKLFQREPVLVYDKTGGTMIGLVHEQLTVYSDGLATYSRLDPMNGDGEVSVRTLTARQLASLVDTLVAVGADSMCDDPMQITDVPLVTVSVLQGEGADAAAHSFSYFEATSGAPAIVEGILRDFIAAQMAGG